MPTVYAPYASQTAAFKDGLGPGYAARIAELVEQKVAASPMPVRTCDIYGSGQEYFDALIDDLSSAKRFIHMNYFIWEKDELTARITAVLMDRIAAGVEVRILNDLLGCLEYSKVELNALRDAGAQVGFDMTQLAG